MELEGLKRCFDELDIAGNMFLFTNIVINKSFYI